MRARPMIVVTAAVLAAALLPASHDAAAALSPSGGRHSAASEAVSGVTLTVDVPPLTVGERSDWIRVTTPSKLQGEMTVTAPTGTRIVEADAATRPLAAEISADGSTASWAGPTTTWDQGWRTAQFRLVPDADAGLGTRAGGGVTITDASGAQLASGAFAVQAVAELVARTPSVAIGATTDWIRILPSRTVQGELTVTAPTGSRIVAADADVRPATGVIEEDGSRAHWAGPTMTWAEHWRVPKVKLQSVSSGAGEREPGSIRVETAAQGLLAFGSYSVLPIGPVPASIIASADGTHTDVRVYGIGDAGAAQVRENRSNRHSDLQPTGRFVRVGDVIEVTVPAGAPATSTRIGLYGDSHQGVTTSGWQSPVPTPAGKTTTITATKDGMVFLQSAAPTGSAVVRVAGGTRVPTFVLGQTSDADFAAQVRAMPDSPLFEVVGNRVFGDFQTRIVDAVPSGLTDRVQAWDDVIELTNDMHDLLDDATGTARKAPHRVYIASPDTGAGYASATQERIQFQVATGAARDLFAEPVADLWGFWHEVGHTYQTPSYNWSGQGEVAVNVSALYVENRMGLPSGIATPGKLAVLREYFAQPVDKRTYASADLWVRLVMYDQLRRAFGNEFYPQLNQEFRTAKALGEPTPSTAAGLQDQFAVTSARIADRDLTEFFRQWGIPLSAASKAEMAKHPSLSVPIWENLDAGDSRVEHELPHIGVPNGTVRTDETVVIGQRTLRHAPAVSGVTSPDGGKVSVGKNAVSALDPGTDAGAATVEARDTRGLREALRTTVDVSAGNSVKLLGQANRTVMWLSLVPGDRELRLVPRTTYQAHASWAGREYIGFELRSPDDRQSLGSWSIRGDETAYALGAAFDEHYEDGQILTVRHQQTDGIVGYTDGEQMPTSTAHEQRFRIEGDRLVRLAPVAAVPSPEKSAAPGSTIDVEAGLAFRQDTAGATGTATFSAPAGTTFERSIGAELLGSYRASGGAWSDPSAAARLSDVIRSADGTELTARFDFRQDGVHGYDDGDELRWRVPVVIPADATPGTVSLAFSFAGTAR